MALPLVLLHGWGLTPRVWSPLRDALPPTLDVHAPPLPGHAPSSPAAGAHLQQWSDALLGELPDRAVLCGWSLGALVALDLAQRFPERVARLVLIGATPRFVARTEPQPWPHGLEAATVAAFSAGFAHDPQSTLKKFIALQALGDARRRDVAAALASSLADSTGAHARWLAHGLDMLATADLRQRMPDIRQPVQLIHGECDALMPVQAARWMAEHLPEARLAVLDGCGHAPFLSRPQDCAALVTACLHD